jgi:hypothetical protein
MKRCAIAGVLCLLLMGASPATLADDAPPRSYGVLAGFGIDPDQFVVGVQAELGRVKMARFAPSLDLGFGDNMTTYTLNGDIRLHVSPPKSTFTVYLGGGPTLALIDPKGGDSDTEIGLSLVAGLKAAMGRSNAYTLEGRFGVGDIPEFRLLAGILFGGHDNPSNR